MKEYRNLKEVDDSITQQFSEAIKFQRLHDTGDVVPMSLFIKGLGTRFTDEKGFGMYLNKAGVRAHFIPSLHPNYFTDFEGKKAVKKYPYVLWFERKNK